MSAESEFVSSGTLAGLHELFWESERHNHIHELYFSILSEITIYWPEWASEVAWPSPVSINWPTVSPCSPLAFKMASLISGLILRVALCMRHLKSSNAPASSNSHNHKGNNEIDKKMRIIIEFEKQATQQLENGLVAVHHIDAKFLHLTCTRWLNNCGNRWRQQVCQLIAD